MAFADAADHWDEVIGSWRETRAATLLRAYSDEVNRRLLAAWLPERCDRLLKTDLFDEAVGAGLYPLLRDRAGEVVGIDVSEAVLEAAARRYPTLEPQRGDVRSLPFESGSFDVVVSNSTLDHFGSIAELERAVRELGRVLRPAGTLVLTLDNGLNPLVALRNALPQTALQRIGLVPYAIGVTCTPRRLQEILERADFVVRELTAIMHVPRVLAIGLEWIVRGRTLPRLLAGERLERLPTRLVSGQFVAVRAVRQ